MKKSLIALAFGTFALGMAEFVMMSILPYVAQSMQCSIPEAGHLISAYAIGVCVGAPSVVLVARKRPLHQILLGLIVIYLTGNLSDGFLLQTSILACSSGSSPVYRMGHISV